VVVGRSGRGRAPTQAPEIEMARRQALNTRFVAASIAFDGQE
jgi:hypothetical protein